MQPNPASRHAQMGHEQLKEIPSCRTCSLDTNLSVSRWLFAPAHVNGSPCSCTLCAHVGRLYTPLHVLYGAHVLDTVSDIWIEGTRIIDEIVGLYKFKGRVSQL